MRPLGALFRMQSARALRNQAILALGGLLLGCTPTRTALVGPFIELHPPAAPTAPARPGPGVVASTPAAAIKRDTAALETQARRYVRRADSKPDVINELSALLLQTTRAVSRMEGNRAKRTYRVSDVITARVAADALAAFLQTRTVPAVAPAAVPEETLP